MALGSLMWSSKASVSVQKNLPRKMRISLEAAFLRIDFVIHMRLGVVVVIYIRESFRTSERLSTKDRGLGIRVH